MIFLYFYYDNFLIFGKNLCDSYKNQSCAKPQILLVCYRLFSGCDRKCCCVLFYTDSVYKRSQYCGSCRLYGVWYSFKAKLQAYGSAKNSAYSFYHFTLVFLIALSCNLMFSPRHAGLQGGGAVMW